VHDGSIADALAGQISGCEATRGGEKAGGCEPKAPVRERHIEFHRN